nr:RNA-directed DNA polymerase, eukaryota [Tanacetum cinerariifolium]
MDIEENLVSSFARKRLCIKTKQADNILEKFKVIFKGKVYIARAKELFTWTLIFLDHKQSEYISDDESLYVAKNKSVGSQHVEDDLVDDSDVEGVSETFFGDKHPSPNNSVCNSSEKVAEQQSEDPFCIYDVIHKKPKDKVNSPLVHTKVMNNSQNVHENVTSNGESAFNYSHNAHNGGSILEVFDDMIPVGQSMGYAMEGCMKDIEHIIGTQGVDTELNIKHKVNFLALQETKMDQVKHMDGKFIWGNSNYQYVSSDSAGSSGEILCIWEATIFKKDYATVSNNFIAIYGTWISNNSKVLIVVIYAPRSISHKRVLWDYISSLIACWNGETIIMGDFNEMRSIDERFGLMFNQSRSRLFNHFITSSGLVDVKLEGYSFTWAHPSATKTSKLDRFLVSEDTNGLIRFKKKLQDLKKIIRSWIKDKKLQQFDAINSIKEDLIDIDKNLDSGNVFDEILLKRMELTRQLHDINQMETRDYVPKSKIKWAIEGDENSKFFHGVINKKRSQLPVREVFVDGDWNTDPDVVKDVFKDHFATRFKQPALGRLKLNISFPNRLSTYQVVDIDRSVFRDEIRTYFMVNVYGPHDTAAKVILWQKILSFIHQHNGRYVLFRDLNEVREESERFGSTYSITEAQTFNSFIDNSGLKEMMMGGRFFTRMNKSGSKMSKLDRFLISEEAMDDNSDLKAMMLDCLCRVPLHIKLKSIKQTLESWNSAHKKNDMSRKKEVAGLIQDIEENINLERLVSSDEIKKAVWDCGSDKAQSPDGFSFQFLKRYWEIFKQDVELFVSDFFTSFRMPPGTNSTFITLLPKGLHIAIKDACQANPIKGVTVGTPDKDTKKINWVKWENILASRKKSGLGFGSLKAFNQALL